MPLPTLATHQLTEVTVHELTYGIAVRVRKAESIHLIRG